MITLVNPDLEREQWRLRRQRRRCVWYRRGTTA